MTHWGMVIDLRKCIGCETCNRVCNDVNFGVGDECRVDDEGNKGEQAVFCHHGMHALQRSSLFRSLP